MSTVTVLVFYSGILFLLNKNMFYFSGWIVSYTYYALFSNFKPDVFNPLVLICGCLLYYKLGAIFIHIKYNTAKSRRKKGTIPNYSAQLKPSSYHSSRPISKEDTMKFTLSHEAWRRAEGGGGGWWGTKEVFYSLLSPKINRNILFFFVVGGGEGISFLFGSPNPRYCSQVWVLIYRNRSIITYTTRYDYNDHKGDINRKTTIIIITQ